MLKHFAHEQGIQELLHSFLLSSWSSDLKTGTLEATLTGAPAHSYGDLSAIRWKV